MEIIVESEWNSRVYGVDGIVKRGTVAMTVSALRRIFCIGMVLLVCSLGPFCTTVQACPGCKTANETESRRPRAYMMSILFMLGMPATIVTGFGVAFYRMSRQTPEQAAELQQYLDQQAQSQKAVQQQN
jgi:hypothetical protein